MTFHMLAEALKLALLAGILYMMAREPVEPRLDVDCVNSVVRVTSRSAAVKKIDLNELAEICRKGE